MEEMIINFVRESNKIEGIIRDPLMTEIEITEYFLGLTAVTIPSVERFVKIVQPGAVLRRQEGLNVQVGNHIAPKGGPLIENRLALLLQQSDKMTAHEFHTAYEDLHPFTDGNGRSGRVLWLRHHLFNDTYQQSMNVLHRGFLHSFYYETLERIRC